ncbi:Bro-N domain-containing protein [Coprococcus sp. RTP21281st1_F1_RTP21281_210402]|uniref:Bro-N domain-containing protein n=1 Tax=Coprococcus sp. RTP21281st1_F1_RTP21281_210402 TaxID=3143208 RepID=UPI0034A35FAA
MNGIQEFVNKDFGTIRTVIIDNEPWFVAKDVCNILGIANPTDALNKGLEDFERARLNLGRQGGDKYH